MKKFLLVVIMLCVFVLSSCSMNTQGIIDATPTPTLAPITPTPEPMMESLYFTALYGRGGMHDISYNTYAFVFNNMVEYNQYNQIALEEYRFNDFVLDDEPKGMGEYTVEVKDRYDKEFFAEHTLIVLFFVEPRSLTIYHEVTQVEQYMSRINIKINSIVPDVGLPAEKYCCIIVELPKVYNVNPAIVSVDFTDVKATS